MSEGARDLMRALGLGIRRAKDAQPSLPQDDPVHLRVAAHDPRIMVTTNRDDFLATTHAAFASSGPHAGPAILMPGVDNRRLADAGRRGRRPFSLIWWARLRYDFTWR
jgi:hypothetical protein